MDRHTFVRRTVADRLDMHRDLNIDGMGMQRVLDTFDHFICVTRPGLSLVAGDHRVLTEIVRWFSIREIHATYFTLVTRDYDLVCAVIALRNPAATAVVEFLLALDGFGLQRYDLREEASV